jgi:nucleotide-binding universal stress UspA family protein
MYKHLMVAYDGSELSDKALEEAIGLAKDRGAKISLLYVLTPHHLLMGGRSAPGLEKFEKQHMEMLRSHANEMLSRAQERLKRAGVQGDASIEEGSVPYRHIVDGAKRRKCDLIVMASHGRRSIEGIVAGSQTMKVLAVSPVPVLVVR